MASFVPVYEELARSLRGRVARELNPGDRLWSLREIAAEAHVSPATARTAVMQLLREGLVTGGGPGRRFFVTEGPALRVGASADSERVAADLITRIGTGELRPGDVIDSVTALVARHAVRRLDARQGMERLVEMGLVARHGHRGRFVVIDTHPARAVVPPTPREMLAAELHRLIDSGELRVGDELPTVSMLAGRYGVSRKAAWNTLRSLVDEGAIEGRGTGGVGGRFRVSERREGFFFGR